MLNDESVEQVSGGTFDINSYSEETYNEVGIKTNYHFWEKDEFYLQTESGNWRQITYDEANTPRRETGSTDNCAE